MEGQTIGHYKLGPAIGRGGFAVVRRAVHQLSGLPVAIKVINKDRMKNKNMISKVTRQVQLLKYINHPNIIKLYEVIDTTTQIHVVMELAQGGQLYEYVQKHKFTEEDVRFFFKQIIEGLFYAHNHLIAHRDLKPQNILLDTNKTLKIADFGLANVMRDGKMLKSCCGSLNYAAPEVISRLSYEGTGVDVWSCGVILFTMLTGSLPFDQEIITVLYNKIKKAEFHLPEFISNYAADLITKMLTVDPIKRIRLHQVRLHPWVSKKIPLYSRIPFFYQSAPQEQFLIDPQIFKQIECYHLPSLEALKDTSRVVKAIKNRLDESFVVAYQLLEDQKNRKNHLHLSGQTQIPHIMDLVQNRLVKQKIEADPDFLYGKLYNTSSRMLIEIVFNIFREMRIEYIIKNNRFAILCTYIPEINHKINQKEEENKNKAYNEEQEKRFSKNEVNFILQLYTKRGRNEGTVMDLKLSQGHPIVFLSLANLLFDKVEKELQS